MSTAINKQSERGRVFLYDLFPHLRSSACDQMFALARRNEKFYAKLIMNERRCNFLLSFPSTREILSRKKYFPLSYDRAPFIFSLAAKVGGVVSCSEENCFSLAALQEQNFPPQLLFLKIREKRRDDFFREISYFFGHEISFG